MKAASTIISAGLLLVLLEAVGMGQGAGFWCDPSLQLVCQGGCYDIGGPQNCIDSTGTTQSYTNIEAASYKLGRCKKGFGSCTEGFEYCNRTQHLCGNPSVCSCPSYTLKCTMPTVTHFGCRL